MKSNLFCLVFHRLPAWEVIVFETSEKLNMTYIGRKKSILSKVFNHEKAYSHNQRVFIPFAFNIFYFQAPYVVDILQRVQMIMNRNVVSPTFVNVGFKMICFVI